LVYPAIKAPMTAPTIHAGGDVGEDFPLARRQRCQRVTSAAHQLADHLRVDDRPTGADPAQCRDELQFRPPRLSRGQSDTARTGEPVCNRSAGRAAQEGSMAI
jgi:hypothetical protein